MTGEEKFAKVFEYVDSSLESVMSIIRTCSYNDWPTFERMFRTAYYTESQGIGYVQHIIKTFQDGTPGFGINIFLECYFAYTTTLSSQGLMSSQQRFSLLTYALPPSYIPFLRTYSSDANLWLSGRSSDVPNDPAKWDRLISLTKQYAVDQQIFHPESKGEVKHHFVDDFPDTPKRVLEVDKQVGGKPPIKVTPSSAPQTPKAATCDFCGSHLPHLDENIETAFVEASHEKEKSHHDRPSALSTPSTTPSRSILSTPSEYLAPQGASKSANQSNETLEAIKKPRTFLTPFSSPQSMRKKDDDTPKPETQGQQLKPSTSSRTNSSAPAYTDSEKESGLDTQKTSPLSPTDITDFSSSDLMNHYNNSQGDISRFSKARHDREFTSPARTGTQESTSTEDSKSSFKSSKKAYAIDEKERRVWELFLRANNKVRSPSLSSGKDSHSDEMPDEDIFNIDEIIASQLEDDDSSSVSSESSVDSFRPEIPVDKIMSQFADPALTDEKEKQLVEKYADVLTCYKMSEFVAYPEELLNHVFEIVLSYTYSTLED